MIWWQPGNLGPMFRRLHGCNYIRYLEARENDAKPGGKWSNQQVQADVSLSPREKVYVTGGWEQGGKSKTKVKSTAKQQSIG